jgi:hypothetical protein
MAKTTSKKTTTPTPRASKPAVRKPSRSNIVPAPPFETKTDHVIGMLRRKDGASLAGEPTRYYIAALRPAKD